ncbi:FUSC family protein [Sphingobium sufflavum]|uniref:FUSC family protein n=1 Tax=Sphingobium sufflavum TaxID=1129547 RepID=UPI001F351CA4|nr:FUSC family protein [Sphingobium sufflavum]MCE7796781.1 FUSC family protein [Sphingobium sufflavum]
MPRPVPLIPSLGRHVTARTVDEVECAVSVLLAILVAHLLGASHISWAAYAGYMVMRGHVMDTLSRGMLRISGTLTGGLLALALAPLLVASMPFATLALFVVGAGSLYATLTARRAYGWLFLGLTFAMVALDKMEHPEVAFDAFVQTRLVETMAGTFACMAVSLLSAITLRRIWPAPRAPSEPWLGWHADAFALAVQGGLGLVLLTLIGTWLSLPALAQSAITIMAVVLVPLNRNGDRRATPVRARIRHRFIGCIAGAIVSAPILVFAAGSPTILILGTVIGVVLGRHLENSDHPMRYAGMQFALAILVILVPDSYADAALEPGLERLLGIVIGMALLEPVMLTWNLFARRGGSAQVAGGDRQSDI